MKLKCLKSISMSALCDCDSEDLFGYPNRFSGKRSVVYSSKHAPIKCLQASEIIQIILDHGKLQSEDILSLLSMHDAKSMFILLLHEIQKPTCHRKKSLFADSSQTYIGVLFEALYDSFASFAEG